jgi:hypothetical protein
MATRVPTAVAKWAGVRSAFEPGTGHLEGEVPVDGILFVERRDSAR